MNLLGSCIMLLLYMVAGFVILVAAAYIFGVLYSILFLGYLLCLGLIPYMHYIAGIAILSTIVGVLVCRNA